MSVDGVLNNAVYDVIVVGAGIMGSSAAYTLAKQGKSVLLLDQFPLPHTRGSSHGATRIIRCSYPEKFIAGFMPAALALWKTLENETSTTLYKKTGLLVYSSSLSEHVKEYTDGNGNLLDEMKLSERFPLMAFKPNDIGYYEDEAGTLYADKCVLAYQKMFVAYGGKILDQKKVLEITPGEVVTVKTSDGSFKALGVVISGGSWTKEILENLGFSSPLQCHAIQVFYWKSKDGKDHTIQPSFINPEMEQEIYGVPSNEYPGLMKICLHFGVPCDPDTRDQADAVTEAEHLAQLKSLVAQKFPYLIPEPAIRERCMYTMTPDKQCIVDTHPVHKNLVYATGFSGHGFKMAPVIGQMVADLVLQKAPQFHVPEFEAARFTKKD